MQFGVLGPFEVLDDAGTPIDTGGRQPRSLLALLVAASGRVVSLDAIADALWGDRPPPTATNTIQSYVSRLRRELGTATLVRDPTGYRLDVPAEDVDFRRFERLADEGRSLLQSGSYERASEALRDAEALWRGAALAEFLDLEPAARAAVRLEERRLDAIEDRIDADLHLGRPGAVVAELSELVQTHPLRERLRGQLALALYRSGRQADALRALADAGRVLREELGVEPSRPFRDLEAAILAQDPQLDEITEVAPVRAGPSETPARVSTLEGRDAELAALTAALDEAAHDTRFAVIEGEPGIGKTRLVDELRGLAEARGAMATWGRSDEGGAAPALWPWLAPLRAVVARVGGDVPVALGELLAGEAPMLAGQADALRFERFEAVADLLDRVGGDPPVVVLLDDLQWADATSLELLAFLAGRLGAGTLVVGTVRQLEVGRNDAVTDALAAIARRAGSRRLQLRGLTEDATAAMLAGAVPTPVAHAIHARAEGNPFYAIELSRLAREEGGLGDEVPGGVGDVVRRRLARLPAATTNLLTVAAVVGRDVDLGLLARAADQDLDAVLDGLDPAVAHRLLVPVPERPADLRFSHTLVREVLLEDTTSLRRARLHLKVADAIERAGAGVDDAEILAEHLWQAAPVGVGHRAADALEGAAEVALHRVAYGAAEDLLTKAVHLRRATSASVEDSAAELDAICRLLEVAKARRYFAGLRSFEIVDRGKELSERLGRRETLLDLLWYEWSACATSCRRDEGVAISRRYEELTRDDPDPEVRAHAHEIRGVLHWGAGEIADAVAELDAARSLVADRPFPTDPFWAEQRMTIEVFWLFHHALHGDIAAEEISAGYEALIGALPDRFAVASICGFASTIQLVLGRWEEAERFVAIGDAADPGAQFAFWNGQLLMQRGVVRTWRGDVDEGLRSFRQGKATYTGIGGRSGLVTFEAAMAEQLATAGSLAEAVETLASARAELDARKERWNEPGLLIAEAVVAHTGGSSSVAAAKLAEARALATVQGAHGLVRRADAVAEELAARPAG